MRIRNDSGIALITSLLLLVVLAVLLQGIILMVNSENHQIGTDRGQNQAFYASLAGLEKLTAGLGDLMDTNTSPTQLQLDALAANPPALNNISYATATGQLSGYSITRGTTTNGTVPSGIYAGLYGSITPYTLASTAHTLQGEEARIVRDLQVVLIPVFQFGVFSETDLGYFPGSGFNFGGRVHTNGNLYLAALSTGSVTIPQKVTAVGKVIRRRLSNGLGAYSSGYTGAVNVGAPGASPDPRALSLTSDSSAEDSDNTNWVGTLVPTNYKYNILDGKTGARRMSLPITNAQGAGPIDIIKRPVQNEQASNPIMLKERHFALASMRILLSDSAAEITSLPYVSQDAPVSLTGTISSQVVAASDGSANYRTTNNTSVIDGYLKVEIQTASNTWQDVTATILSNGFTGPNLVQPGKGLTPCASPSPSSIIRFQRLKDTPSGCTANSKTNSWPNVLYDPREGALRPGVSTTQMDVYLGGVIHYIELDIANLCAYLMSSAAIHPNEGYLVYFSDRRTNKNSAAVETGEYGNEDAINSADVTNGAPDAGTTLPNPAGQDPEEDVNGNGYTDVYGKLPQVTGVLAGTPPLDGTSRPNSLVTTAVARQNRAIFFRRALKLINGATISLGTNSDSIRLGLSITSENPVYVQGDYNASGGFYAGANRVAAAVMADAVTVLSNNWSDIRSFNCPHSGAQGCTVCGTNQGRVASNTWYSMAVIAGKSRSFINDFLTSEKDFGTDGGINNFLHMIENWDSRTLYYQGSLVSMFYSRQAMGTYKYKYQGAFFSPPTRNFAFNTDFQDPARLPPFTPRFRDINITGFTQMKMPD